MRIMGSRCREFQAGLGRTGFDRSSIERVIAGREGMPGDMPRYVAMLPGVNVNGRRMLPMADLQRVGVDLGFRRVATYIQSGNLLFEADDEPMSLARQISSALEAILGEAVHVTVRSLAELTRVVAACPFDEVAVREVAVREAAALYVAFFTRDPAPEARERMAAAVETARDNDRVAVGPREAYILYRHGVHGARWSNAAIEARLGVAATSRNWRTVTTLVRLLES
jgi:uncharacterized protein (DUF1697 family)